MDPAQSEVAGGEGADLGPLKVFISYSRSDVQIADDLELALRDRGFAPLIDRHGIDAGDAWKERLGELIFGSDTVLFVLTDASAASNTCAWEAEEAVRQLKRVLVVSPSPLSSGVKPPEQLAGINWIHCWRNPDVPGSSYQKGVIDLDKALRVDLAWLRQRTLLHEQAVRWQARGAHPDSPLLLRGDFLVEALAWARATPRDIVVPQEVTDFISASEVLAAKVKAEAEAGLAEREAAIAAMQKTSRSSGRSIFFWNFVGLTILVVGVLLLSEMRAGLTDSQMRSLRAQGDLIANLLIETGTIQENPLFEDGAFAPQPEEGVRDPSTFVNEAAVRAVLRRIVIPRAEDAPAEGARVRVFSGDGRLIADTDVLYDRLEEAPLETNDPMRGAIAIEYLRLTPWRPTTSLADEQRRAMQGEITRGERLNERGERVVSVTLPLRRVQSVLGTITLESADVERIMVAERASMIPFIIGAFLVTLLSSLLLTTLVARPLRRLAEAAGRSPG